MCWWCGSARQTTEHLFEECVTWQKGTRELWAEVGEASRAGEAQGNTAARMYKGKKGFFLRRHRREAEAQGKAETQEAVGDQEICLLGLFWPIGGSSALF